MYKTPLALVFSSLCALLLTANCTITSASDKSDGGSGTGNGTAGTGQQNSCVTGATEGCLCDATTPGLQHCVGGVWAACGDCASNGSGGSSGSGSACVSGATQACLCAPNVPGVQACIGTGWGPCGLCATGSGGSGTGGSGSAGYAGYAGYSGSGTSGASGSSGTAGASGGTAFADCDSCLAAKCQKEFDGCIADMGDPDAGIDIPCLTNDPNNPGQYQQFIACMEAFRSAGNVDRDSAVTCGNFVVSCSGCAWPPMAMTKPTADLINCMATDKTNTGCTSNCPNDNGFNNSWADPATNPTFPWPAMSCAKTSCTAKE